MRCDPSFLSNVGGSRALLRTGLGEHDPDYARHLCWNECTEIFSLLWHVGGSTGLLRTRLAAAAAAAAVASFLAQMKIVAFDGILQAKVTPTCTSSGVFTFRHWHECVATPSFLLHVGGSKASLRTGMRGHDPDYSRHLCLNGCTEFFSLTCWWLRGAYSEHE